MTKNNQQSKKRNNNDGKIAVINSVEGASKMKPVVSGGQKPKTSNKEK